MIRGAIPCGSQSVNVLAGDGARHWTNSQSWVEYFDHPVLSVITERTGCVLRLLAYRPLAGSASTEGEGYFRHLATARAAFTEYISIVVERDGAVTLETGPLAVTPLYWASDTRGVYFSWKLEDLVGAGLSGTVDAKLARAYIWGKQRYESSTLFRNIKLLSERSSVRAMATGVEHCLPENSLSLEPRNVLPDADVCGAYISLFGEVLASQFEDDIQLCLELSGGFDSSNVALATSEAGLRGLTSYGLIFPGDAGRHQTVRRNAVVKRVESIDSTLQIKGKHFLDSWLTGSRWVNPYDETYRQLVEAGLDSLSLDSSAVMLTGIGGDEAFLPRMRLPQQFAATWEARRAPVLPKAVVPETALLAANVRAPMFMSRGVWPSNPYCSRDMIEFSERLPDAWKQSRFIQREAMQRWGLESAVLERPVPENFESALRAELVRVQPMLPKIDVPATVSLGICSMPEWETLVRPTLAKEDRTALSVGFRALTLERSLQEIF